MKRLKRITSAEEISMQDQLGEQISDLERSFEYITSGLEQLMMSDVDDIKRGMQISDDLAISLDSIISDIADIFADGNSEIEESVDVKADTVKKKNGKWVNRGDTGEEHGEFSTKKEADAQRKAMYAKGFKG